MKTYLFVIVVLMSSFLCAQVNPEVVGIKLFDDTVKVVYDTTKIPAEMKERYFNSLHKMFSRIETGGQAFLDDFAKYKMWLVPKSLADQVDVILAKHGLVVRWKHDEAGYKRYEYLENKWK